MSGFPSTSLLDAFPGADGPPGASWITPFAATQYPWTVTITNHQLVRAPGAGGNAAGVWSTDCGPDCEVWCNSISANGNTYLFLRAFDNAGAFNGYLCFFQQNSGQYNIYRYNDGVATRLTPTGIPGPAFTAGEQLGATCWGQETTAIVMYQTISGVWGPIGFQTDTLAPIMGAGKIGVGLVAIGHPITNFGGGTMIGDPDPLPVITKTLPARGRKNR